MSATEGAGPWAAPVRCGWGPAARLGGGGGGTGSATTPPKLSTRARSPPLNPRPTGLNFQSPFFR